MTDDVLRALGRIEGEMKGLRYEFTEQFTDLKTSITSIEQRVRNVERVQDRILAYSAGAGAVAGAILAIIKDLVL